MDSEYIIQLKISEQQAYLHYVENSNPGHTKPQRLNRNCHATIANLSESTLVKWYERKLVVKPETELKIYEATTQFYKEETLKLKNFPPLQSQELLLLFLLMVTSTFISSDP